MSKCYIFFGAAVIFLALSFFVLFDGGRVIAETPLCANTEMESGKELTCKVAAENTSSTSLDFMRVQVTVSSGMEITSQDNTWSCVGDLHDITCTKEQLPALNAGESDFLTIKVKAKQSGTFSFDAHISGAENILSSVVTSPVTYTDNEIVSFTETAQAQADAEDDDLGSSPHALGCLDDEGTVDISINDVLCEGITTFAYRDLFGPAQINTFEESTGILNISVYGLGYLFTYDILCDGVVADSATVTCEAGSDNGPW